MNVTKSEVISPGKNGFKSEDEDDEFFKMSTPQDPVELIKKDSGLARSSTMFEGQNQMPVLPRHAPSSKTVNVQRKPQQTTKEQEKIPNTVLIS